MGRFGVPQCYGWPEFHDLRDATEFDGGSRICCYRSNYGWKCNRRYVLTVWLVVRPRPCAIPEEMSISSPLIKSFPVDFGPLGAIRMAFLWRSSAFFNGLFGSTDTICPSGRGRIHEDSPPSKVIQ